MRVLVGLFLIVLLGLRIWSLGTDSPKLLARADVVQRVELYGQIATSAAAMLAAALTVLAILTAFPDRPRVEQLREMNSWRLLQNVFLVAALFCFVTLVLGHIAAATDNAAVGCEVLEDALLAAIATAIAALLTGGAAFAVLLAAIRAPSDPSAGRGTGPAGE